MGFLYDQLDTLPLTVAAMSSLQGYVTGPVWSGSEAAIALQSARCPPGSICCDLDVKRLGKAWYPYVTDAGFVNQSTIALALGNMYSPARLLVKTTDGASTTPVSAGRLMVSYSVELIEPMPTANNV